MVLAAVSLPMLFSCSNDRETEKARVKVDIDVIPCAPSFVEVSPITTRAWTPPEGYLLYDHEFVNGQYVEQANLINNTIGVFFTQDGSSNPEAGSFFYDNADNKWHSSMEISSGNYYLYGFISYESGVTPTISPVSGSFSNGAILTLNNLPTVTPSDVCVVVGAKNGISEEEDGGLITGQFAYETQSGGENHVFLLFDHLYSALNFKIKVEEKYNALRRIYLKQMALIPYNGTSVFSDKTNVTVTLASNTEGASPITSVTYTPVGGGSTNPQPLFQSQDNIGYELKTTETFIRGCFAPQGITEFTLRSTYDVYDRYGNLIRKDCVADNKINLAQVFVQAQESYLKRGTMYSINMTIRPTYLYMLSEPDLDNPTITIEN